MRNDRLYEIELYRNGKPTKTLRFGTTKVNKDSKFDVIDLFWLKGESFENINYSEDINMYIEENIGLQYKINDYSYYSDNINHYISVNSSYLSSIGGIRMYYRPIWNINYSGTKILWQVMDNTDVTYRLCLENNKIRFYPNYTSNPSIYIESDVLGDNLWRDLDWNFIEVRYDLITSYLFLQVNDNLYAATARWTHNEGDYLKIGSSGYYDDVYILKDTSCWVSSKMSQELFLDMESQVEVESNNGIDVINGEFTNENKWRICPVNCVNDIPIFRRIKPNTHKTIIFKINHDVKGRYEKFVHFRGNQNFSNLQEV